MPRGCVCMLGTPSRMWQAVYNFSLAFTSCCAKPQGQRWEIRAFSSLPWAYTKPYSWMWFSRLSGIYWRFLMPSRDISFPIFPLSFLVSFLFTSIASGSCNVKQLLVIIFDKFPRRNIVCSEWTLSYVKKRQVWINVSRELWDRQIITVF